MAASRPLRWLIVLGLPALVLLGLSLWAIDKPNVVWKSGSGAVGGLEPVCPLCRTSVRMYSSRCPTCRQDVEWVTVPSEDSPLCAFCLAPGEVEALAARRRVLSDDVASTRVAEALTVPAVSAKAYLGALQAGRCGWCGGTGVDLATEKHEGDCPVCFGEKDCIGCAGERRVTVGKEDAELRLRRYRGLVAGLGSETAVLRARQEIRDANEQFLSRNAGTLEAHALLFWPAYRENPLLRRDDERPTGFEGQPLAGDRARDRIVRVLRALRD